MPRCLSAMLTCSPLYIPAPTSSMALKGMIGTVRRFSYAGSINLMYRS